MNEFGSQFKYFYYLNAVFLLVLLMLLVTVENFGIQSFFIVILIFCLIDLIELYISFNGIIFKKQHIVVCNFLVPEKFRVPYENIERIVLINLATTASIKIFTKDWEQKRFFLRGFSKDDLKKCSDKFNELGIDTEFEDRS